MWQIVVKHLHCFRKVRDVTRLNCAVILDRVTHSGVARGGGGARGPWPPQTFGGEFSN